MAGSIDIYEFKMLSEPEQYQFIWSYGTYLMDKTEWPIKLVLYDCGKFYCEVKYNAANNSVAGLTAFKNTDRLSAYLDSMTFPDI